MKPSESGFFKYVWRFNALAIAGAAVVCILLGLYAAATIFKEETRSRRVTNVVNVGEKDNVSEEFALGSPTTIAGTPYVRIPLYRGQSYSASYYSKRSEQNAVNYLFLNISTNESRWLFERAGQLIVDSRVLFSKLKSSPDEPQTGVGVFHVVVERDSNGDNRLTEKDAVSLATSAVDGANYRKLIEGIEQLYSVQQIADDKVLVLYQKNQQTISELYSLPRMERLMQANIPKVDLK
ncbi:hypothetical protein KIP88_06865 [Bradyrhizobium sp. SRL28]|uniref:hypothetical protein n=1 Tax=Bradyrhizobium sp. SRL28 TaxID=2836178 RepID=UPI001BDEE2A2|nr:hypothetical protein [Bradyrhizobium sp. SRL28]MBT1510219.1 hypothetical protein [Bradyrhizobium sp. SRL28]